MIRVCRRRLPVYTEGVFAIDDTYLLDPNKANWKKKYAFDLFLYIFLCSTTPLQRELARKIQVWGGGKIKDMKHVNIREPWTKRIHE